MFGHGEFTLSLLSCEAYISMHVLTFSHEWSNQPRACAGKSWDTTLRAMILSSSLIF